MIKFLTYHKCLIQQGAAFVNMLIIFFMGGVTAQHWLIKQYGITINVLILIGLAFTAAWLVGIVMVKSGIIKAEQTFYAEQNDVLDELRKKKQ